MKKNWLAFITLLVIMATTFSIGTNVIADDDDDDEKQEYYQKDDDEDDDEEDWKAPEQNQISSEQQNEFWNIWSREPRNNQNNLLPIAEPAEIAVVIENKQSSIYFIPQNGQLLVSAQTIANVLDAEAKYYSQSKIIVMTKGKLELIVRAGSNAAFENGIKTPMPLHAAAYENSVYLPVSVAANALGFRVSWDLAKNTLLFQPI